MTTSDMQEAAGQIARLESLATRHDVIVQGRRVAWRRFGQGEPLVLLHGGHGSWLHWSRNLESWSRTHTLWVPDMPGYGDSDPAAGPGLDDLVQGLSASLDSLLGQHTPVRLGGFSFGGLVAAALAAHRPGISHLVLLGPGGHGSVRRTRGALRAWREFTPDTPAWHDVMRHNLLMHMLYAEHSVDALALAVHGQSCLATRFHSSTMSRRTELKTTLGTFDGPVLLAWGEHDITATPTQAAATLVADHPDREWHLIGEAGHWVQYEQAEAVNTLVADWLARTDHGRSVR